MLWCWRHVSVCVGPDATWRASPSRSLTMLQSGSISRYRTLQVTLAYDTLAANDCDRRDACNLPISRSQNECCLAPMLCSTTYHEWKSTISTTRVMSRGHFRPTENVVLLAVPNTACRRARSFMSTTDSLSPLHHLPNAAALSEHDKIVRNAEQKSA